MLVLTRKFGERIRIGTDIYVHVEPHATHHNKIRLCITAPEGVKVMREELLERAIRQGIGRLVRR